MGIVQRLNNTTLDNLTVKSGGELTLTGVTVTGLVVPITGSGIYSTSIANMQALTLDDGAVVTCTGYYADGDGYIGSWRYDEFASDVNDYGSYVPHDSTGGFYRLFPTFEKINACDFGVFPNSGVIDANRLTSWFAFCELTGATINYESKGNYIHPDTYGYTFQNSIRVTGIQGAVITSFTGSNFANRQPEFIDVTLNGAKLKRETMYRVRYTAKDAVVHSTYSALTPILRNEYLYKDADGNWSKKTKTQVAAENYLLPIDVGYISQTITYTSGSSTITTSSNNGFRVGDVVSGAMFPANTTIVSVSGSKTSWSAEVSNNATSSGTGSVNIYAALPTLDGYYIVEAVRDTYSGSLNPKSCPQFPTALELRHGDVIQKSGATWTHISKDFVALFNMENGASIQIDTVKFENLRQFVFNYAHGVANPTNARLVFESDCHNVNRVCAKSGLESSISGGTINDNNIRIERLNPNVFDMAIFQNCKFSNIGQLVFFGVRSDHLIVENVAIENTSSMITAFYTIDALNVSYKNVFCNYLRNYDNHNGLWLRGGQLSTTFDNLTFNDCAGICLYASGNKISGGNLVINAIQEPQYPVGGSALLIKGGGNSTEYSCNISNSQIYGLYSASIAIVRDSDIFFDNCKFYNARNINVHSNTQLNEGTATYGQFFSRNYNYTISDAGGLSLFESRVSANYRDTSIGVGDTIYFEPTLNMWVKNLYNNSPPPSMVISLGLSHKNIFQTYKFNNCIFDTETLWLSPDKPTYNMDMTGCTLYVNRIGTGGTMPDAVQRWTMNGCKWLQMQSGDAVVGAQIFLNNVEIYRRKNGTPRLNCPEIYLNEVKIFNSTDPSGTTFGTYALRAICTKFKAYNCIIDTTYAQGRAFEINGATEIDIQGGSYKMYSDVGSSFTPTIVDILGSTTLSKLIIGGIREIDFSDQATKRLANIVSNSTAITHAIIRDNSYIIDPTNEINIASGSASIDTYKSIGNDHNLAAASLTNASPITTSVIFNRNDL